MNHNHPAILATQDWIKKIVIQQNFCPFAKKPFDEKRIDYIICEKTEHSDILEAIMQTLVTLEGEQTIETSLVILPAALVVFDDYLDCLDMAVLLLKHSGYEGIFQIASFHPDYIFEGNQADASDNYTNRSPYPCFHILREASLAEQIDKFPNVDDIPQRNIEKAQTLGVDYFKKTLNTIIEHATNKAKWQSCPIK